MDTLPMPHRGARGRALRLCALIVMTFATSGCLVYDEDVSTDPRFEAFYGKCFELKADAFLWRWKDTKKPELSIPGEAVDDLLPATVEEYRQHPTDWYRRPPYDTKFRIGSIGPGEVVAVVPQGSRFTVSKVLFNHNVENGTRVVPLGRLQKPVTGVDELGLWGLIDGGYDLSRLTYDANLLKPCIAPLPPGTKLGPKISPRSGAP